MPRLPEYINQLNIDPSPLAYKAQAQARAGEDIGRSIRQGVGAVTDAFNVIDQRNTQEETTKLAADLATAQADLTVEWNETAQKADPNDHELAARFMRERVKPTLDKIGADISTRGGKLVFEKASAGVGADFLVKTTADQSTLAGQSAIVNLNTVKNQISQAVRNDPSGFQHGLELADLAIEGLKQSFGLPSDKALELQANVHGEIARSVFIGMADINPTEAKAALARGDFAKYFDGTTAKQMASYADQQEQAGISADKAAQVEQRRQEKEAADTVAARISASTVAGDGSLAIPQDYFANVVKYSQLPQSDAGQVRAMINAGKAIVKDQQEGKVAVSDPAFYDNFRNRMYLGVGNPRQLALREVYQARAEGKLSDRDFTFFRSAVESASKNPQKTAEQKDFGAYLKSRKNFITKSSFMRADAYGDQRFYEFSRDAQATYDQMRAQGKAPHEIEATIDRMIPKYQVTKEQAMGAIRAQARSGVRPLGAPRAAVTPRKPGESIADWEKRTGGK